MKVDKNILNELQQIAPLLSKLDKVNFYEVQEGYFADSQIDILKMIGKSEALSPVLSSLSKRQLYTVPVKSYFESFSENLTAKIHAEEVAEELSYTIPILQHIEKKESYEVPASYFASFPETITTLAKEDSAEHSQAVKHWSKVWGSLAQRVLDFISRPVYSFAMASAVGMIVCIGLVINTHNNMSDDEKIFAQMQQLPDADLHSYIDRHRDEFDERTILHNISNVDFTHDFGKTENTTSHTQNPAKGSKDDDISNEDILD